MAQPGCTLCGDEQGVLMSTIMSDGDTTVVGVSCLPGYALALAGETSKGLPPEAADDYGPLFDVIAANDPRPKLSPTPTATAAGKRTKSAQAADAVTSASTPGDAATGQPGASSGNPGEPAKPAGLQAAAEQQEADNAASSA